LNDSRAGNFRGKYSYAGNGTKPSSSADLRNSYRYTWENTLNYNKSFDKNVIYALVGTTTIKSSSESFSARGANQPSNTTTFYDLGANADSKDVSSNLSQNQLVSTFARVNYIYNDRYTFQASIRIDGSSVLAKGHKWGYFPSVSGAWNIINEDFMKNVPVFNNLKLRASWGKAGNSSISPYGTLGGLSKSVYSFAGIGAYGYYPSTIPNPDLTWETTSSWNIGIDFSILKNRISGTMDTYLTKTSNLLLPALLPTSTGYNSVMQNVGKTENKGVEVTLTTVNIKTSDFSWTTDYTFTLNREKIVSLNAGVKENVANLWFVGQPVKVFYDYKKIGIWQLGEEEAAKAFGNFKPGEVKVEDKNQNGVFDTGDRQVFPKVPDFIAGLNTVFTYKDFDLSAFFYARAGQTIEYDYYYYYVPGAQENSTKVDYWTPENPTNAFPQPNSTIGQTGGLLRNSWSFADGSFLKIREITIGYNLPERWMTKINIQKIRLYSTLANYFKWGKLNDYDSENDGDIVSPIPRQAVFGIDVIF
jgi:TonB-dependent starch-binding outer membrane protein SusC